MDVLAWTAKYEALNLGPRSCSSFSFLLVNKCNILQKHCKVSIWVKKLLWHSRIGRQEQEVIGVGDG